MTVIYIKKIIDLVTYLTFIEVKINTNLLEYDGIEFIILQDELMLIKVNSSKTESSGRF